MTPTHRHLVHALLASLTLIGVGCGGEDPNQLKVRPEVRVVNVFPNAPLLADKLVFAAAGNDSLLAYKVGDVLVSRKGPTGFLRRVNTAPVMQGDTIVIGTDPATITDIFGSGNLDLRLNPTMDSATMGGGPGQAHIKADPGDISVVLGSHDIETLGIA